MTIHRKTNIGKIWKILTLNVGHIFYNLRRGEFIVNKHQLCTNGSEVEANFLMCI